MATGPYDWQHIRARPALLGSIVVAVVALVVFAGLGVTYWALTRHPHHAATGEAIATPAALHAAATPPPVLSPADETSALSQGLKLQPLDAEQARQFNAGIPISTLPNPPARPFALPATLDPMMKARATDCLAAALYYEAGHEPVEGQRAVAQVVLNRVRHFAYPKSVCEVVFQDSDKPNACQFTFSCDGSMLHAPDPKLWDKVRAIAAQALAGRVEKVVGWSTHYHADYVAPYWQPYLIKVGVLGQHIFYRGADGWSAPVSFAGAYSGVEPDETLMTGLWSPAAMPPPVVDPGVVPAVADVPTIALAPPSVSGSPAIGASAPPSAGAATGGLPAVQDAPGQPAVPSAPAKPTRRFPIPIAPGHRRIPIG